MVAARLTPRCAVELPERGSGQLDRVIALIGMCHLSIHDLSRSGSPTRFNMPFELGLAAGLAHRKRHEFILMESRRGRLERTLSDLRGVQPLIHRNGPLVLIARLTDNLSGARPLQVERIYRRLLSACPALKRAYRVPDVFQTTIFKELVSGAVEEVERAQLFAR
ncbi:MAG: hypothetical protein HYY24_24445 [Verrucomicrobia bacterium]|nr:hypothetical protein [Verrucomicrobiota bacterium]